MSEAGSSDDRGLEGLPSAPARSEGRRARDPGDDRERLVDHGKDGEDAGLSAQASGGVPSDSLVPEEVRQAVVVNILAAVLSASEGRFVKGYDILLSALRDAKQASLAGAPWGRELMVRYHRAIGNYIRRFMVPLTEADRRRRDE